MRCQNSLVCLYQALFSSLSSLYLPVDIASLRNFGRNIYVLRDLDSCHISTDGNCGSSSHELREICGRLRGNSRKCLVHRLIPFTYHSSLLPLQSKYGDASTSSSDCSDYECVHFHRCSLLRIERAQEYCVQDYSYRRYCD